MAASENGKGVPIWRFYITSREGLSALAGRRSLPVQAGRRQDIGYTCLP
jgi:hypothetical protein